MTWKVKSHNFGEGNRLSLLKTNRGQVKDVPIKKRNTEEERKESVSREGHYEIYRQLFSNFSEEKGIRRIIRIFLYPFCGWLYVIYDVKYKWFLHSSRVNFNI